MPSLIWLRLAVVYDGDDGYKKWQSWPYNDWIRITSKLVFDPSMMEPEQREIFNKENSDWRENPCLVRYRTDGQAPDFFCKRGANGKKDRKYAGRGRPLSIEFQMDGGNPSHYHCDEAWLKGTAALEFHHDPNYDPAKLTIVRISPDGASRQFNISATATPGQMKTPGKVDDYACGFPYKITREGKR